MNRGQDEDRTGRLQRGKIIAMNYDAYNALPGDTCLYCLTDKQQMILIALLEQIGWPTRWYSPSGATIDRDTIEGYRGDLAAALMSDVCAEIMTKLDTIIDKENELHTQITTLQTDLDVSQTAQDVALAGILSELSGIVEPALAGLAAAIAGVSLQVTGVQGTVNETSDDVDNIETIIADPDDGLAEVSADVDNIELLVTKLKTGVTNVYNNSTTINVSNYVTFSALQQDAFDNTPFVAYNALCQAVYHWMRVEGYAVEVALGAAPTDLATLELQIDATFRGYWSVTSTGLVYSYTLTDIITALNDTTAMDNVACQIIGILATLTITQDNFNTMFAGFAPAPFTPEDVILNVLSQSLQFLDAYTNFVAILQLEFVKQNALNPTSYNCPACLTIPDGCGVPLSWDFSLLQKGPWLVKRGAFVQGTGIVGVQNAGQVGHGVDISITWATPCHALIGHNVEVDRVVTPTGGNAFTIEWYYLLAGVPTIYNTSTRSEGGAYPTVGADSFSVPTPPGGAGIYKFRYFTNVFLHQTDAAIIKAVKWLT